MTFSAMRALSPAATDRPDRLQAARLSTDYLNRYGEALMLIEMVPMDGGVLDDLKLWQPLGYREHFDRSSLRCASSALRAYEGLEPARRDGFEQLCMAMNRLVMTTTALLADETSRIDASSVVDVVGAALRRLIGRATQFINANGQIDMGTLDDRIHQDEIDALLAQ